MDTRLLDWTDGALIGLYFAVRDGKGYEDAAVWVLGAWELNQEVVHKDEVIPPGDPGTSKEDRERYDRWLPPRFTRARWPHWPAAIYPGHIMPRIGAQRSCFAIHGRDPRGLDAIARELNVRISKILIPSWCVQSIRRSLETCGIDEATVFPDLEGLGKQVNRWLGTTDKKKPHNGVYTRLRPSNIDRGGVGVFAIRKIMKGKPIFPGDPGEMTWIEQGELPLRPNALRDLYDDFAVKKTDEEESKTRYGCPVNFDRLTPSWYLNHSPEPNVRSDEHYNFYALMDIKEGDELTYDYSSFYSERRALCGLRLRRVAFSDPHKRGKMNQRAATSPPSSL